MTAGGKELDETRWWREFEEQRERVREEAKRQEELHREFKRDQEKARTKPIDTSTCGTIDPILIDRVIDNLGQDQQNHNIEQNFAVIWHSEPMTDRAQFGDETFEMRRDEDLPDVPLRGSAPKAVREEIVTPYQRQRYSDPLGRFRSEVTAGVAEFLNDRRMGSRGSDALLLISLTMRWQKDGV
jgi:hypothetical protein